jgi:hypothetical protein
MQLLAKSRDARRFIIILASRIEMRWQQGRLWQWLTSIETTRIVPLGA